MNLSLLSVKFIYLKKKTYRKRNAFLYFSLLRLFHFFKISLSLVCHAILLFLFFFFCSTVGNFSLFDYVPVLALLPQMKFNSTLVGLVIHFSPLSLLDKREELYLCSNTLSYLPRALSLPLSPLCSDDITPWRLLKPILSCSCFVFSSASGLSQMEAAADCMPQKAGN